SASLAHALAAAESKAPASNLTAAQVVDKHVEARGGLQAWRAVQTLSMSGKLDAGSGDSVERSARLAREGMGASAKRAERAAAEASVKAAAAQQMQLPFRLTMKSGDVQHIWIDAQSFLDVKVEGIPRRMDGKMRSVWVYQRDFRSVQGLKVPYLYETAVESDPRTHRMVIEAVAVNRTLDDVR